MAEVLQKMIDADVIVLSSPVYFYSIDAQLKALIDRTVARWLEVKNKEFYYIVTAADGEMKRLIRRSLASVAMPIASTAQRRWASSTVWAFTKKARSRTQRL